MEANSLDPLLLCFDLVAFYKKECSGGIMVVKKERRAKP
jgi:hypothetical protein